MEVWRPRNHSVNTHLVFVLQLESFFPFLCSCSLLGERKCWKETRATFPRALEDSDFGKKKIISLFSHFFQPLRRCARNNLKNAADLGWLLGMDSYPLQKSNEIRQNPLQTFPESQFHLSPSPSRGLLQPRAGVTSRGRASASPRPFVGRGTVIQFPPNCTNKDELGLSSTGASDRCGVSHGRRSQRLNKTIMLMSNNTTASGN